MNCAITKIAPMDPVGSETLEGNHFNQPTCRRAGYSRQDQSLRDVRSVDLLPVRDGLQRNGRRTTRAGCGVPRMSTARDVPTAATLNDLVLDADATMWF